jgi:hypothetical protein
MKRNTLYIAIAIGANTMYFQIGRRDTLLSAFSPILYTLPSIYPSVATKLALSK